MALQLCKKRFMSYVNRDHFDRMCGLIDALEYHSMFVTSAKLFNLTDCVTSTWMHIMPTCTTVSALTAGTLFLISIVHYVRVFNVHLVSECGTYFFVMLYKIFMRIMMARGKKCYYRLLKALKDDFHYISTNGQKYRDKFLANQRLTFQACLFVAIFLGSIGAGMSICACIAAGMTLNSQDDAGRPLPYPFWFFDYDLHASPLYEVLFISSMLFTIFHTNQYICYVSKMDFRKVTPESSQLLWIREVACRADIITWNLHDLLVDVSPARSEQETKHYAAVIKRRMTEILEMHHSMYMLLDDYASVFKKCLLFEQLFAGPIICMTAYSFAEKFDQGEFKLILLLLCISTIWVVFVPCYLCDHLLEKVQSVGDACWAIPFWNAGPVLRPYLVLIMQRSLRPLPIVAAGFADISLQTYSRIMTRAYSCFNMLRQADFNFS